MLQKKLAAFLLSLSLLMQVGLAQSLFPKAPAPWQEEYAIVLGELRFSHPMTNEQAP